jgi:hypothetical protein
MDGEGRRERWREEKRMSLSICAWLPRATLNVAGVLIVVAVTERQRGSDGGLEWKWRPVLGTTLTARSEHTSDGTERSLEKHTQYTIIEPLALNKDSIGGNVFTMGRFGML